MEERFKYIHFKSEFFYNLLILNPSNYIKLIKIQIIVNVSSKRRLGQDPTKYQGRLKVISDDFALYAYPYLLRLQRKRPRRGNWIRLGRQIYLYLHRSRQLRALGTGSRLDNRRRKRRPTSPLLPEWMEILVKKIMEMVHFLGSTTKIM